MFSKLVCTVPTRQEPKPSIQEASSHFWFCEFEPRFQSIWLALFDPDIFLPTYARCDILDTKSFCRAFTDCRPAFSGTDLLWDLIHVVFCNGQQTQRNVRIRLVLDGIHLDSGWFADLKLVARYFVEGSHLIADH
jgi:hypothetical protein